MLNRVTVGNGEGVQCALYLRLSKEDEGRAESASMETQRKILREFAAKKGFQIYDEYADHRGEFRRSRRHHR